MDNLSFNAPVSGVKFFTNSKGTLVPIVTLDKEYTAKKDKDVQKFDGITMSGYEELTEKKIGKGAVIHIKFDEKLMPVIDEVIKTGDIPHPPTNCLYCNTRIVKYAGQFLCINHLCPAQGRTGIFKLIIGCLNQPLHTDEVTTIHKWLNSMPCNDDVAEISYYYEFLVMLRQEKDNIGQAIRLSKLKSALGDSANYLYALEIALLGQLRGGLKPNIIWNSLSLPFEEKDAKKLADYDFNASGKKKLPKLSEHGKKVIDNNIAHIELIFAEIAKFANK